jgi:choline transport protein
MTLKEKGGDLEAASPNQELQGSEIEVSVANHTPVLEQSFGLISACATGITTGNSWAVLGGGIVSTIAMPIHLFFWAERGSRII